MATPLLDFQTLMAPIAGDQPAGGRLSPDVRKKLDDARKEFEPNPDDPSQPPIPKKPDWAGIIKLAGDTLTNTSKDLETAARLTEALAKRHDFAGLRDGLTLLRLMLTEGWERIHPIVEGPDDLEYRAGPIAWITDPESGAWFPASLRRVPLLKVHGQAATLDDCENSRLGDQPLTGDDIRAAAPAQPGTPDDVAQSLRELDGIEQALASRMGDQAPSFAGLRDVLEGCQKFLGYVRPAPTAQASEEKAPPLDLAPSRPAVAASRTEVYRQLAALADHLAMLEPHSPIPDLLRWAVRLGQMPFRELIQELVREPTVLADIRRQFGIKESENPSNG